MSNVYKYFPDDVFVISGDSDFLNLKWRQLGQILWSFVWQMWPSDSFWFGTIKDFASSFRVGWGLFLFLSSWSWFLGVNGLHRFVGLSAIGFCSDFLFDFGCSMLDSASCTFSVLEKACSSFSAIFAISWNYYVSISRKFVNK